MSIEHAVSGFNTPNKASRSSAIVVEKLPVPATSQTLSNFTQALIKTDESVPVQNEQTSAEKTKEAEKLVRSERASIVDFSVVRGSSLPVQRNISAEMGTGKKTGFVSVDAVAKQEEAYEDDVDEDSEETHHLVGNDDMGSGEGGPDGNQVVRGKAERAQCRVGEVAPALEQIISPK